MVENRVPQTECRTLRVITDGVGLSGIHSVHSDDQRMHSRASKQKSSLFFPISRSSRRMHCVRRTNGQTWKREFPRKAAVLPVDNGSAPAWRAGHAIADVFSDFYGFRNGLSRRRQKNLIVPRKICFPDRRPWWKRFYLVKEPVRYSCELILHFNSIGIGFFEEIFVRNDDFVMLENLILLRWCKLWIFFDWLPDFEFCRYKM